jgi:hypothetical protein
MTIVAALLFIGVSATMNALFLSSLGRSSLEVGLLAAVSIASESVAVTLMLATSRPGATLPPLRFCWRGGAVPGTGRICCADARCTTARGLSEQIAAARRIARNDARRPGRFARRTHHRGCKAPTSTGAKRPHPAPNQSITATNLRQWLGVARRSHDRDDLTLRGKPGEAPLALRNGKAQDDPQALVLGRLLGLDTTLARIALTSWTAVILELGSVIMVLLAAGPALGGWRERGRTEPAPLIPAELPLQPDRHHWQRQRSGMTFGAATGRVGHHVGK